MNALIVVLALAAAPANFERHDIAAYPAGYQTAVADVNGDGRPDVLALSTESNRVDWFENPTWKQRPIARTERNIDLAVRPAKRGAPAGPVELAVASGFYFADASRGGQIWLLRPKPNLDEPWTLEPVGVDPVVHRLRWADLDGDGEAELVHAPIFGPGSQTTVAPKPSHLWAFKPPREPGGKWSVLVVDESLTVLHGLWTGDLGGDRRDELLTASYAGIHRIQWAAGPDGPPAWKKTHIAPGAPPIGSALGAARGTSEAAPGRFAADRRFIAAIEPWHGNQVVVYTPGNEGKPWRCRALDETLSEGHALAVADFDGDGCDEIVAGWRGAGGGLRLYDPLGPDGAEFQTREIDRGVAVEGLAVADLNGDGRLDLVAIAGRNNLLAWYKNP